MLTVEQMIERLKDRRIRMVAKSCGISYQTIYNMVQGRNLPSYETLKKLSDYLEGVRE
jgi:predicted DNA-binding transcriptional regulator AlpA